MKVEYSSNNSGGSWWLSDDDWRKLEKAGWEIQWCGRQNQFLAFFTETRDGDLGLQGFTLSFEFDF